MAFINIKEKQYAYKTIVLKDAGPIDRAKTVSFVGPRPHEMFGFSDETLYKKVQQSLKKMIAQKYTDGYRKFITGGQQGFTQLAFWEIHDFIVENNIGDIVHSVYVPFESIEATWPDEGLFGKSSFYAMLELADEVKLLLKEEPPEYSLENRRHAIYYTQRVMYWDSAVTVTWHKPGERYKDIEDAYFIGNEVINLNG